MKRIIVCLDVRDGKTTKGVKFVGNVDIGDPVLMAAKYYEDGVDELVFYDITASHEGRSAIIEVVERVAERIFIPFTVGGGIGTVAKMRDILNAGADKISVNSAAVKNPRIIRDGAEAFGNQCIVLGMDAERDKTMPSGYSVLINGGRTKTGLDALAWALEAEKLGAGEIVLNSVDADGTKEGYECELTELISRSVKVPVVASGGAGEPKHLAEVLTKGKADAALVASIVHYDEYPIPVIKEYLKKEGTVYLKLIYPSPPCFSAGERAKPYGAGGEGARIALRQPPHPIFGFAKNHPPDFVCSPFRGEGTARKFPLPRLLGGGTNPPSILDKHSSAKGVRPHGQPATGACQRHAKATHARAKSGQALLLCGGI